LQRGRRRHRRSCGGLDGSSTINKKTSEVLKLRRFLHFMRQALCYNPFPASASTSFFCSPFSDSGICTPIFTYRSPLAFEPSDLMPHPFSLILVPGCIPAGTLIRLSPSRV